MQTKWIVLGIIGIAVFLAIRRRRETVAVLDGSGVSPREIPIGTIPRSGGMVPCPNNPSKMYDPSVAYFADPCR